MSWFAIFAIVYIISMLVNYAFFFVTDMRMMEDITDEVLVFGIMFPVCNTIITVWILLCLIYVILGDLKNMIKL